MLTTREKGINLAWLVLIALPSAGLCYFCILHFQSVGQLSLGVLSAVLLFGALFYFVPGHDLLSPKRLMKNSFPLFFASYFPSAIGDWQSPSTVSTLIWPIILFRFLGCSERLHEWAREGESNRD